MYAPSKPGDQPSVEVSKEFMMSPNKLHLGKRAFEIDNEFYKVFHNFLQAHERVEQIWDLPKEHMIAGFDFGGHL